MNLSVYLRELARLSTIFTVYNQLWKLVTHGTLHFRRNISQNTLNIIFSLKLFCGFRLIRYWRYSFTKMGIDKIFSESNVCCCLRRQFWDLTTAQWIRKKEEKYSSDNSSCFSGIIRKNRQKTHLKTNFVKFDNVTITLKLHCNVNNIMKTL